MEGEREGEELLFAKLVPILNSTAFPFIKDLSELVDPEFVLFDSLASLKTMILYYFTVINVGV